ncbi:MAG: TraR/DksA C4-type zinc finger protein [Parcubacteria group bacterium]|nr:TraR/DksA C4-type zinc finger protein [Parcubacteria group bacterium]
MNTDTYKEKLLTEKVKLEEELADIGQKNPNNPNDWEATPVADMDNADPDKNIRADAIEEYANRIGVSAPLEARLTEVNAALLRIEEGTYGVCEISGEKIEEDRLEANPAARTCKAHMND